MLNRNTKILLTTLSISHAATAGINDTGITTCSNETENGLPCPVSGYPGQDAEYGTNAFNFTKIDANGNAMSVAATNHSCVKDNVTGLMWEVKTDDGGLRDKDNTYNFDEAATFAASVNATNLCGHNDWRVPNPHELASIVDYSIASPGPTIDEDLFPNTQQSYYWTNSPHLYDPSTYSWIVHFYAGDVGSSRGNGFVRCVRAGQSLFSFSLNSDGNTVTEQTTGLMWAKCPLGQSGTNCENGITSYLTWGEALTAAQNSTVAGYTDWRLPNAKELQTLADYTKYGPAINTTYFPNTPSSWFWTSSPYVDDSYNYSWIVSFNGGNVLSNNRYSSGAVRLVRAGQWLFLFSLNKSGNGTGSVVSSPAGINCGNACSANFAQNSTVTLTAAPATGSVFAGWSGACSGTATTCNVTMNADKTATATFNLKTFTVTPSLNPASGGTVTPNTAQTVNYGATKTFTVTPNSGYTRNNAVSGSCPQGSWTPAAAGVTAVWTTGAITATCTVIFNFTAQIPIATTNAATNITAASAALNGSVISAGATATVSFDFGTTTSYGESITATPTQVYSASAVAVSATKTGLTCNSTYHYRTKAVSSAGSTGYGMDQSFTTTTCPPPPVNGSCGTANGSTVATAPTTNLCSVGTASAVTGTGPWQWTCAGSNGGTTASCSANLSVTSYTVTPSATTIPIGATGGSFFPETATTVTAGTTTSFTVIPATNSGGYTTNPAVTGTCPLGSWGGTWNNIWTTGPITANCTVIFGFTAINAWAAPPNQTMIPDQAFTLDVTVKSNSVRVGRYDFVVTFDTTKLRLDTAYQDATGLCISGICPGTSALVNRFPPIIDGNTITLTGYDATGKGPGNDLQLLVMHFRSRYVAEAPSFVTAVALKTNLLATAYGDNIGTGARGATVNVSTGLCGDADGNTAVNIVDALAIARKVVGMPPPPTVEDVLADVNKDARVAIGDALQIARYSVGLVIPPEVCAIGRAF